MDQSYNLSIFIDCYERNLEKLNMKDCEETKRADTW